MMAQTVEKTPDHALGSPSTSSHKWDDAAYGLLTDGEKHDALMQAARQKHFALARRAYWEQNGKPRTYPVYTSDEYAQNRLAFAGQLTRKGFIGEFAIDEDNRDVFNALCLYFTADSRFESECGYSLSKGILLAGGIGCGKTTMMKVFASNQVQSYYVDSCVEMAAEFASDGYDELMRYYTSMATAPAMPESNPFGHQRFAFCFDDFGAETQTMHYGNKSWVVENILFMRHHHRMLTHATMNLSLAEISDKYKSKRLDSRLHEMFNLIVLPGHDRRR